jgi:hypothetical protein
MATDALEAEQHHDAATGDVLADATASAPNPGNLTGTLTVTRYAVSKSMSVQPIGNHRSHEPGHWCNVTRGISNTRVSRIEYH